MLIRRIAITAWNHRREPSRDEGINRLRGAATHAEWDALAKVATDLWGPEDKQCHKLTAAEVWAAGHTIVYGKTLESSKRRDHG
jgi:hypothetical protein